MKYKPLITIIMKHLFTLIIVFLVLGTQAQITKEHTYNDITTTNGEYIIVYNTTTLKLYNSNHSLYKTITLNSNGATVVTLLSSTEKFLFDSDSEYEFMLRYYSSSGQKVVIINENGSLVKEFAGASSAAAVNVGGQGKLFVYLASGATDIYSLPGTVSIKEPESSSNNLGQAYPNPATSSVTIPYKLDPGTTTTMNIYNATGQLIESFTIDSNFQDLILDTSSYTKGTYFYSIGTQAKKLIIVE